MNKAGRELDFGDAMSGGYHLLELCKQAIGGLRIERGGHAGPPLKSWPPMNLVAGFWIDLKNSEGVSFGVDEVALPAGTRYRELGKRHDSAQFPDDLRCCVEILYLQRADKSIRARLWRGRLGGPLQQSPSRTSGLDGPVRNGEPGNQTRISIQRLENRNQSRAWYRRPGFRSKCDLYS